MNQPAAEYRPPEPFFAGFWGCSTFLSDWPNSVMVRVVTGFDPSVGAADEADLGYADRHGDRQFVEVDTNYKPGRQSRHPAFLTRTGALDLAGALLKATEDTFHLRRCGSLRAAEAAELLRTLDGVDTALAQLREHALGDLIAETTRSKTPPSSKETTTQTADPPAPTTSDQQHTRCATCGGDLHGMPGPYCSSQCRDEK